MSPSYVQMLSQGCILVNYSSFIIVISRSCRNISLFFRALEAEPSKVILKQSILNIFDLLSCKVLPLCVNAAHLHFLVRISEYLILVTFKYFTPTRAHHLLMMYQARVSKLSHYGRSLDQTWCEKRGLRTMDPILKWGLIFFLQKLKQPLLHHVIAITQASKITHRKKRLGIYIQWWHLLSGWAIGGL